MTTLVVGIGSTILADDGVGVHAARAVGEAIRERNLADVHVLELGTAGLALLDAMAGYERLILLDAIVTGQAPGTIHELDADEVEGVVHLGAGHEADLPTVLAMGRRALGEHMPSAVRIVAIEAKQLTDFSESMTPEVEAAMPEVVERVLILIRP